MNMLLCIANSLVASREVDGTLLPRVLNCPWRLRNVILFFGKKKKSHFHAHLLEPKVHDAFCAHSRYLHI